MDNPMTNACKMHNINNLNEKKLNMPFSPEDNTPCLISYIEIFTGFEVRIQTTSGNHSQNNWTNTWKRIARADIGMPCVPTIPTNRILARPAQAAEKIKPLHHHPNLHKTSEHACACLGSILKIRCASAIVHNERLTYANRMSLFFWNPDTPNIKMLFWQLNVH